MEVMAARQIYTRAGDASVPSVRNVTFGENHV